MAPSTCFLRQMNAKPAINDSTDTGGAVVDGATRGIAAVYASDATSNARHVA